MAENKWEMARQDYLLAKQLQGLSQWTLNDYDMRPGDAPRAPTSRSLSAVPPSPSENKRDDQENQEHDEQYLGDRCRRASEYSET
jgi:hypothetical protein